MPRVPPAVAKPAQMPTALARSSWGNTLVIVDRVPGINNAAPIPIAARSAISWPGELAVAASAEIAPSAVVDCVASLVTKSLVTANVGDATDHHRLLETTRAYAIEKLAESGELTSVGRRHAEYYRDLFERAAAEWETQPAAEWSATCKPRVDNVRAALDWAFAPRGA